MFIKAIKQTGYAFLAAAALSIGSAGLTTTAKAAPLHINPLDTIEIVQDSDIVDVRSRHGFRGHHRGVRSSFRGHRSFNRSHFSRGHRKSFKSKKFSRHGKFRGQRFSRHGSFRGNRFSRHRGGFRGHRFSGRRFH